MKREEDSEPSPPQEPTTISRHTAPFQTPDMAFKVIFVGDTGTGKTCMIRRLVYNEFEETHSVTIGGDFVNTYFEIDRKKVKLQLWDTCGLEQYRSLVRLYFKGAHAAIIAYDMSQQTKGESIRSWHSEIRDNTVGNIPIYLVGTKSDLGPSVMPEFVINGLVSSLGMAGKFETSSKTGTGVSSTLDSVLLKLYRTAMTEEKANQSFGPGIRVDLAQHGARRRGKGCC